MSVKIHGLIAFLIFLSQFFLFCYVIINKTISLHMAHSLDHGSWNVHVCGIVASYVFREQFVLPLFNVNTTADD